MIDVNIVAEKVESVYRLFVDLGNYGAMLKWDTGARYTVISARALAEDLTNDTLAQMKKFFERSCTPRETFVSASGDPLYGYLAHAENVMVGDTELTDFYYYLVLENKRDIALLGFDFIDNCKRTADSHGDIIVTEFDEASYGGLGKAFETDELAALIESLT